MSIVLVTGSGAEHRYVANTILAEHDVAAILVCDPPRRRSWARVLQKSPLRFADKALKALYLKMIGDRETRTRSLRKVLGDASDGFARPDLVVPVGKPRDGLLAKEVARIKPDIIAVYGTGIIDDDVLRMAQRVALNMHTGLSPWYRGVSCAVWPIIDMKPDMVGATVHECTSDVDGGRIFFRQAARIAPDDDLHAVFARAVAVGAAGYARVIADAKAGTLTGEPQDLSVGKEYRGDMLGLGTELRARRALRRLHRI